MPAHRVRGHFFEELAADDGDEPFAFPESASKVFFFSNHFTVMDKSVRYPNVTIGQFPHYPVLEPVASLTFVFDPLGKGVEYLLTMGFDRRPPIANESSTLRQINIRRQEPDPHHLFELRVVSRPLARKMQI